MAKKIKQTQSDRESQTPKGLMALLADARIQLLSLVIDHAMHKIKDVHLASKKRKEIARLLTALRQKELSKLHE